MRIHLKPWQDKDKGSIQDINLRLTGKELANITVDIGGNKFILMESRGKLYIQTTDGKPLSVDMSAANAFYIRRQDD